MPSILLHEVEPVFPRGPGEIDPGVKGPHAHGEPLTLPYPTSLAGTLITSLYNLGCLSPISRAKHVKEWFKDFEDFYNWIKGPYVAVVLDNNITSLLIAARNGWIRLDKGLYKILAELLELWSEDRHYSDDYFERKGELMRNTISMSEALEERVSIALKYDEKVVREHYLTTLRLIDYSKLVDKPLRNRARIAVGIDIGVKNMDLLSCVKEAVVVRVSGRGRGGVLELWRANILEEEIKKLNPSWETPIGSNTLLLYVASPLILLPDMDLNSIKGSSSIYPPAELIYKYLMKELEAVCGGKDCIRSLSVDGVVSIRGLGYSLRFNERKPLHNVLLPGSLIFAEVENCQATLKDIYVKGLGHLKHLGFGTVIPVIKS